MVSGWDKKPGPGNDYTPLPASLWRVAFYICLFVMLAGATMFVMSG